MMKKILTIYYATIFLASLYTINSYGSSLYAPGCSYNAIQAHNKMNQAIIHGTIDELNEFFKYNTWFINEPYSDSFPFPPLSYCIRYRHPHTQDSLIAEKDMCDAVQTFINYGAQINTIKIKKSEKIKYTNPDEYLPIILWARLHTSVSLLEILLKNGASINQEDNEGTVLHHLIYRITKVSDEKILTLIKTAIEKGANPLIKNKKDKTCFDIIQEYKHFGTERIETSTKGCATFKLLSGQAIQLLNKAELLLKENLAPQQEIKTDNKVHLKYIIKDDEN